MFPRAVILSLTKAEDQKAFALLQVGYFPSSSAESNSRTSFQPDHVVQLVCQPYIAGLRLHQKI